MDNNLKNKKILLGISGSIASYKAPLIVRELVKSNAIVNVIMTPSAKHFVSEMVLSNLSGNPVISEMFSKDLQMQGAWHIQMAHWCDLMLIAPCSATTLARIANGFCDTALSAITIALPRAIPLLISPAMDTTMWEHPATQKNVETLINHGVIIIPPEEGELSSGLSGSGRLPEIKTLIEKISNTLSLKDNDTSWRGKNEDSQNISSQKETIDNNKLSAEIDLADIKIQKEFLESVSDFFKNKKILITAGPTYEKIDDVRFIGNFSSGKMGFALAEAAHSAGAEVTLVSGPVSLETPKGIQRINVESAKEMFDIVTREFTHSDIAIMSAAVADYSPSQPHEGKIKKIDAGDGMVLKLRSTDDILLRLGSTKKPGQKLIGFALESSNEISNGWKKMKIKNCNMIVVNSANKPDSGFGGDLNTITILMRDGSQFVFEAMSKLNCAREILKKVVLL